MGGRLKHGTQPGGLLEISAMRIFAIQLTFGCWRLELKPVLKAAAPHIRRLPGKPRDSAVNQNERAWIGWCDEAKGRSPLACNNHALAPAVAGAGVFGAVPTLPPGAGGSSTLAAILIRARPTPHKTVLWQAGCPPPGVPAEPPGPDSQTESMRG